MTQVGVGVLAFLIWALPWSAALDVQTNGADPVPDPGMCRLAEDHVRRYPRAGAQDLYKFAHQAAFGAGHAVPDARQARDWLVSEIEALSPGDSQTPDPPLFEPLLPDGSLVRVHLRPWLEAGHDSELLLAAFVRTANTYKGSQAILMVYWECFRGLARDGMLAADAGQLDLYVRKQQEDGWPPRHHSAVFESEYAPAYRVVAREHLPTLEATD